jgi:sugar (pentulose or hexulose) kinase
VSACVLAIDLGTGGPKVALVDRDGTVLAREFEPNTVQLHPGGGAEQSPADWWRAITTASRRLLAGRDADVRAVAVTGQWAGTVALDEHGEPLGDAVIWLDSRGAPHARRLAGGRASSRGGCGGPAEPRRSRGETRSATSCGCGPSAPSSTPPPAASWSRSTGSATNSPAASPPAR